MNGLCPSRANAIYDVLVECCGASETERDSFVHQQATEDIREWRFCGNLGFGGKFWRNNGRFYVSCYREDETPERLAMIAAADKRLAEIQTDWEAVRARNEAANHQSYDDVCDRKPPTSDGLAYRRYYYGWKNTLTEREREEF